MKRLTISAIAVALALSMSTGCKTNDGNPDDSPSKGFDKCLNSADC